MFAYLAATPFLFINNYRLDPSYYGYFFAVNMIGAILLNGLNGRLVAHHAYRRLRGLATALLVLIGIALAGITLADFGGLYGIAAAVFALVGLAHVIGSNGLAGIMDLCPDRAGTASASFAAGMLTTLMVGVLNDGTARPLGIVVFICALIAALCTASAIHPSPEQKIK